MAHLPVSATKSEKKSVCHSIVLHIFGICSMCLYDVTLCSQTNPAFSLKHTHLSEKKLEMLLIWCKNAISYTRHCECVAADQGGHHHWSFVCHAIKLIEYMVWGKKMKKYLNFVAPLFPEIPESAAKDEGLVKRRGLKQSLLQQDVYVRLLVVWL